MAIIRFARLEQRLLDNWRNGRPYPALVPLGGLYSLAMKTRRMLYGPLIKVRRAEKPVISLGNLTVGGSGKTPLTLALARMLLDRGWRPAILSRGYGRRKSARHSGSLVVGRGQGPETSWLDSGDEPWLMAARLPGVRVVVDSRRIRGAKTAVERLEADILLLDDGFQHLSLAADCRILLVPARNPFGNGAVLPAGPLRESLAAHRLADILVCTGAARPTPAILELAGARPVFAAEYRCVGWLALGKETLRPPEVLTGRRVLAFCGLGRPENFAQSLAQLNLDVRCFVALRDHQAYGRTVLNDLGLAFSASGAECLVTTEKDAVKIPADFPLPVMVMRMEMVVRQAEDFLAAVLKRTRSAFDAR